MPDQNQGWIELTEKYQVQQALFHCRQKNFWEDRYETQAARCSSRHYPKQQGQALVLNILEHNTGRVLAHWSTEQSIPNTQSTLRDSTATVLNTSFSQKPSGCHSSAEHSTQTQACLQMNSVWSTVAMTWYRRDGLLLMFSVYRCFFLTTEKCSHKSVLDCGPFLFLYDCLQVAAGAMSESTQTPRKDLMNIVLHMTYKDMFTVTKLHLKKVEAASSPQPVQLFPTTTVLRHVKAWNNG